MVGVWWFGGELGARMGVVSVVAMSAAVSVVWFLGGVGMSPPWGVRCCFGLCTARSFVYTHCFWGFSC